jgi:hypothetical protein
MRGGGVLQGREFRSFLRGSPGDNSRENMLHPRQARKKAGTVCNLVAGFFFLFCFLIFANFEETDFM